MNNTLSNFNIFSTNRGIVIFSFSIILFISPIFVFIFVYLYKKKSNLNNI